jgi:hypothetical protein
MKLLHLFIIVSLLLLILINIYNYFKSKLREGITSNINSNKYQNYDELENKDPMFLAIKNAANISYIKTQLDELKGIKQEIFDLSNNVYNNEKQIDQIQQAIQDQAEAVAGGSLQNPDDVDNIEPIDNMTDDTTLPTDNIQSMETNEETNDEI